MGKPVSVDFERGISGRALLRRPVAYNDSGIGVVVALMIFLSHTVLQPLELAWNVWAA
jgi:hypothetical protein